VLAATWIALEDAVAGTSELAYCERSHKLPNLSQPIRPIPIWELYEEARRPCAC
jgi:hypothetical protein